MYHKILVNSYLNDVNVLKKVKLKLLLLKIQKPAGSCEIQCCFSSQVKQYVQKIVLLMIKKIKFVTLLEYSYLRVLAIDLIAKSSAVEISTKLRLQKKLAA